MVFLRDKSFYFFVVILFIANCRGIMPSDIQYYSFIVLMLLFSFINLKRSDFDGRVYESMKYMFCPWLFAIVYSVFLYIIGETEFDYIQRGFSMVLRIILFYFCGLAILSNYNQKALDFLFWSFFITYFILTAKGFLQFGFAYVALTAINLSEDRFVWSETADEFDSIFEVHEFGLAMPILALAYVWRSIDLSKKIFPIFASIFISLACAKRISIAAFFIVSFVHYLCKIPRVKKFVLQYGFYIFLIVILGFLWFVYSGLYSDLAQDFNVDLRGRDKLYSFFVNRSDFSLSYLGWGFGFIGKYLNIYNPFNGILGLHNDVLMIYLELGFVASLVFWYLMYGLNFKYHKLLNLDCCYYFILVSIYCLITYFTDNSMIYGLVQLLLLVIPYTLFVESCNKRSLLCIN